MPPISAISRRRSSEATASSWASAVPTDSVDARWARSVVVAAPSAPPDGRAGSGEVPRDADRGEVPRDPRGEVPRDSIGEVPRDRGARSACPVAPSAAAASVLGAPSAVPCCPMRSSRCSDASASSSSPAAMAAASAMACACPAASLRCLPLATRLRHSSSCASSLAASPPRPRSARPAEATSLAAAEPSLASVTSSRMAPHLRQSGAIGSHQHPSEAISIHQKPSASMSSHQQPSAAISSHRSDAIGSHRKPLEAIKCNRLHSARQSVPGLSSVTAALGCDGSGWQRTRRARVDCRWMRRGTTGSARRAPARLLPRLGRASAEAARRRTR